MVETDYELKLTVSAGQLPLLRKLMANQSYRAGVLSYSYSAIRTTIVDLLAKAE